MAIPAADIELLDTWNVVGLGGTGSNDFKLTNYFLPADLAGREDNPYRQVRGRLRYDLVDVEHLESILKPRRAIHSCTASETNCQHPTVLPCGQKAQRLLAISLRSVPARGRFGYTPARTRARARPRPECG